MPMVWGRPIGGPPMDEDLSPEAELLHVDVNGDERRGAGRGRFTQTESLATKRRMNGTAVATVLAKSCAKSIYS